MDNELDRLIKKADMALNTLEKTEPGSKEHKEANKQWEEARTELFDLTTRDPETALSFWTRFNTRHALIAAAQMSRDMQEKYVAIFEEYAATQEEEAFEHPEDEGKSRTLEALRRLIEHLKTTERHPLFYKLAASVALATKNDLNAWAGITKEIERKFEELDLDREDPKEILDHLSERFDALQLYAQGEHTELAEEPEEFLSWLQSTGKEGSSTRH